MNLSKHHWNYFLAIEKDLDNLTRFVEFHEDNFETYSIELTRILLTTSSEIDVLLKLICNEINSEKKYSNINDYRDIITEHQKEMILETIFVHRYGFEFNPWKDWLHQKTPVWWKRHNQVKHDRHIHFNKASLENTLNALGALYITVSYYYLYEYKKLYSKSKVDINMNRVCELLNPKPCLFQFKNEYHRHPVYFYD
jgi:hypothetical protein